MLSTSVTAALNRITSVEGNAIRDHRALVAVAVVACAVCGTAEATDVYRMRWADDTRTVAIAERVDGAEVMPAGPGVVNNYDNWSPPFEPWNGQTNLTGRLRVGSREVGDDMNAVGERGILDSFSYTYSNFSPTGSLTGYRHTVRWRDATNAEILREFTYTSDISIPIRPGVSVRVFWDTGSWRFLGFSLPDSFSFSSQFSNPVGIDPEDFGVRFGGPLTVGSSSQFIRDFTNSVDIDLAGSNQVNMGYAMRSFVVPSPGTAILLVVPAMLCVLSRKR